MPTKIKLILFVIFLLLAGVVVFLMFHETVSAPHAISIKNEPLSDELPASMEASAEEGASEKVDDRPKETAAPEKKEATELPATDYPTKSPSHDELVSSKPSVTNKLVSFGFTSASGRKIDTIIIHSSYNALGGDKYDVAKLIAEYEEYGVAPHYLIDRKGKVYLLVEEKNIAYHAGESKTPDGRTGVNNFSIGIEIMTTDEEKPTSEQYVTLKKLISDLKSRYSIKYTLGHSDIAAGRKTDPWNFEWKKLQ